MILRALQRKSKIFPVFSNWLDSQRHINTKELEQLSPEAIINDKIKLACINRLRMTKMNDKCAGNTHKAAVLVPLCIYNGKLGLLYTLRSNKVSMNRGQVSFPGGMEDSKDLTLKDTALRETWEELQIPKQVIDIWGTANLIKRKHVTVLPVLGYIGEINPKNLHINKSEVEEAFVQPLEMLCDPKLCRYTHFRNAYTLPIYLGGNYKIWGLTAVITHLILRALVPDVYKHELPFIESLNTNKLNTIKTS